MRLRSILLALVVLSCSAGASAATGPPSDLTKQGRTLWQFEALLHDTFGNRVVSAHGLDFACANQAGCAPLAYWSPYFYTFTEARHSAFHLSSRHLVGGDFGNYAEIVRIKGKVIACDRPERHFLIVYGDGVAFSLDCLTP